MSIGWATHGFTHSKQIWVGDGNTQITFGLTGLKTYFVHGLTGPNQMDVGLAQNTWFLEFSQFGEKIFCDSFRLFFSIGLAKSIFASRFVFSGFDSLNPYKISPFSTFSSRDFRYVSWFDHPSRFYVVGFWLLASIQFCKSVMNRSTLALNLSRFTLALNLMMMMNCLDYKTHIYLVFDWRFSSLLLIKKFSIWI